MAELSTKPYLIRAIYEWCNDNGYRPYIAVVVDEHTAVPREFVRNGEIVLNVSPAATNRMQIGNELLEFEARFGGVARHVSIPIENISAIFAQENGHGMAFEVAKAQASEDAHEGDAVGDGRAAGPAHDDAHDDTGDATGGAPDEVHGADAARQATRSTPSLHDVARPPGGDAAAGAGPRASKRSRRAPSKTATVAPDDGKNEGVDASNGAADAGSATPDAAALRPRRKPRLQSVPTSERQMGDRPAGAAPGRRAPIAAVPRRTHDEAKGDAGNVRPAEAPDGDGPDRTPPSPRKPRLTRVK